LEHLRAAEAKLLREFEDLACFVSDETARLDEARSIIDRQFTHGPFVSTVFARAGQISRLEPPKP